jgi:hypothetical protein
MFGLTWESRKLCIKAMHFATGSSFSSPACLIKCGTVIEFPVVARYHHPGPSPSNIRVHVGLMSATGFRPVKRQ